MLPAVIDSKRGLGPTAILRVGGGLSASVVQCCFEDPSSCARETQVMHLWRSLVLAAQR